MSIRRVDYTKFREAYLEWLDDFCHGNELPNGINLQKLKKLLMYSDRYEISIQFWPETTSIYISKHDVELTDFGNDFATAIDKAIEYLDRINGKNES